MSLPSRGEIWFARIPTDPAGKPHRPIVIVSLEGRNQNPRATTVMVVPLSTTPKSLPFHVELSPGETGLTEVSCAKPENLTTLLKSDLVPSRRPLRRLGELRLRQLAAGVQSAMGFPPST